MKIIIKLVFIASLFLVPITAGAAAKTAAFTITFGDQKFAVEANTFASWKNTTAVTKNPSKTLQLPKAEDLLQSYFGIHDATPQDTVSYSYDAGMVYDFVKNISTIINTPPSEPSLTIENNRASSFIPPKAGEFVDLLTSTKNILEALENGQKSTELAVSLTPPQTELGSLNNLGIQELVGEGVSTFNGSPNNRRFNIKVGVEKMRGIIIPQGGTFSFNENLGPVDGEHGFLPELVIKSNATIPEFGGGLCQVSSTTFRAAMQAGLPITERRNHSYAVQYYAPQGTDATIYPGSVDLKFVNDTPGAVLVWPYFKDINTLVFDFYGTKDNRQVTLEKPIVFDRKSDGSMKATWTRLVTKDGEIRTDVFKSNYLPPAQFHHTQSFVPASTSTPLTEMHVGTPQTN